MGLYIPGLWREGSLDAHIVHHLSIGLVARMPQTTLLGVGVLLACLLSLPSTLSRGMSGGVTPRIWKTAVGPDPARGLVYNLFSSTCPRLPNSAPIFKSIVSRKGKRRKRPSVMQRF